jgi:hypothetical protein
MTKIETVIKEICALKKRISFLERKYSLENCEVQLTLEPINVLKTTKKAKKVAKKADKKPKKVVKK